MKKLNLLILAVFCTILVIGCTAKTETSGGEKQLLETMNFSHGDSEHWRYFNYDDQNRIIGISYVMEGFGVMSSQAITYHDDGSISVYDHETFYEAKFNKKGNIITVFENEETSPTEILTINKAGLITKREKSGEAYGDWTSITKYQYKGGNPIKLTTETITKAENTKTVNVEYFKYDDMKSPFYYSKTPKWFMQYSQYNKMEGLKNNVVEYTNTSEKFTQKFTNEYNSEGLLTRQTTINWNNDIAVTDYTYSKPDKVSDSNHEDSTTESYSDDSNGEVVKIIDTMVIEVFDEIGVSTYFTRFYSDEQNRLTEVVEYEWANQDIINRHTFTYSGNELVAYEDYWSEMTIQKEGNMLHFSYGDTEYKTILNDDSAFVKQEIQTEHGSGVSDFEYFERNLARQYRKFTDSFGSSEGMINFLYDDKKSPFLHSQTPKWILQDRFPEYGLINNMTERTHRVDGEIFEIVHYVFEYDDDGYPIKRTALRIDKDKNESKVVTTFDYVVQR